MPTIRPLGLAALSLAAAVVPLAAQREAPPAPATPKAARLPATRTITLPNGMQATLIPFGTTPKVTVRLVQRFGNLNESAQQVWLADLAADALNEGTATRTATQLAEEVAGMGGQLGIGSSADEFTIGADVLAERAADLVAVIADVARNPRFPESEMPRLVANRLRQLAIQRSTPQVLALQAFRQALYGDHPYGRVLPDEALLKGFTMAQVRDFYRANSGAQRAHLYVAGVFDAAAVERAIRAGFAGWARGPAPLVNVPRPAPKRVLETVDRPNAVQSTIYAGLPVPDPTHPDYVKLAVMNALLGGAFSSRITSNIREQKGYTYSPFSQVSSRYHDAYWAEIADVTTAVTGASLKEIHYEIDRLRREAPSAEELRGVQNYLVGTFTLGNASRGGLVSALQQANLQGLGERALREYVGKVLATTPADVRAMAQQHIDPAKLTLVVVGDRKVIDEQLRPYQPGTP